jgi:hypothetical protein
LFRIYIYQGSAIQSTQLTSLAHRAASPPHPPRLGRGVRGRNLYNLGARVGYIAGSRTTCATLGRVEIHQVLPGHGIDLEETHSHLARPTLQHPSSSHHSTRKKKRRTCFACFFSPSLFFFASRFRDFADVRPTNLDIELEEKREKTARDIRRGG